MFEYLRKVLSAEKDEEITQLQKIETPKFPHKKYQVATAALLIEIAKADGDFSYEERERIIALMKKDFELDDDLVGDLLELSEQKVKDSISVYEFSKIINESFTKLEKIELLKNLWRIVYVDGRLDSHEDQLIKIIGSTLNLEHKDIIGAKLFVKQEMGR